MHLTANWIILVIIYNNTISVTHIRTRYGEMERIERGRTRKLIKKEVIEHPKDRRFKK